MVILLCRFVMYLVVLCSLGLSKFHLGGAWWEEFGGWGMGIKVIVSVWNYSTMTLIPKNYGSSLVNYRGMKPKPHLNWWIPKR